MRDAFDPLAEELTVKLISPDAILDAEALLAGCEGCSAGDLLPFDRVLDAVTGSDPTVTDYIRPDGL